MLSGPEHVRLLTEFECQFMEENLEDNKQHEQGFAAQELFRKLASSLYETILHMVNPFSDGSSELLALDSQLCE